MVKRSVKKVKEEHFSKLETCLIIILVLMLLTIIYFKIYNDPLLLSPKGDSKSALTKSKIIEPQGPINKYSNSVEHGKQQENYKTPLAVMPQGSQGDSGTRTDTTTCNVQSMSNLDENNFVNYLKSHDYNCLYFLWFLNSDSDFQKIYSSNNIVAVAKEIGSLSNSYDGTNKGNMLELIFFIRTAYYYRFYQKPVGITEDVHNEVIVGLKAISKNPHLFDVNDYSENTLWEFIMTVDNAWLGHLYVPQIKKALLDFTTDSSRAERFYQRNIIYSIFYLISREMNAQAVTNSDLVKNFDKDIIGLINDIATKDYLIKNQAWLADNAIWALGNIASNKEFNKVSIDYLSKLLTIYPRLDEQYLWTVKVLDYFNGCKTSNPKIKLCMKDVMPEVELKIFTNTYSLEDNSLIIKTPLDSKTIQTLYNAINQVKSQFNRITNTITPIKDDPNSVLMMKVYGTRRDYEIYQPLLYGLPTANGGIYIEQQGTFYTYQRTTQESIYSLEELLRHEYAHYLVSRWLIPGMWGENAIYNNNRMVWFDEGLAEFLAWSTQLEIKTRKLLVEQIYGESGVDKQTGAIISYSDRMTIKDILSSSYGDFKFYRYSGMFWNYLYLNKPEILKQLLDYAHNSNLNSFDSLINQLKADSNLESNYQKFLDEQIAKLETLDNPHTDNLEVSTLNANDPKTIEPLFRKTRVGQYAKCSLASQGENSRFSCRGVLTTTQMAQKDYSVAWKEFNSNANEMITDLISKKELNNFNFMNCRFGQIVFNEYEGKFYALSNYFCDGPLAKNNLKLNDQQSQVSLDFKDTRVGAYSNCDYGSTDTSIICTLTLTTQPYDIGYDESLMEKRVSDDLIELQNEVYSIRPSYYRDFFCAFSGNSKIQTFKLDGNDKKYLLRNANCNVQFKGWSDHPLGAVRADSRTPSDPVVSEVKCIPPTGTNTCVDTDDGVNYIIPGTVCGYSNKKVYTANDYCITGGTSGQNLVEYSCSNGKPTYKIYDCATGNTKYRRCGVIQDRIGAVCI
ncbi:MAG: collagenase [Nanoarchaeota archaeon]